MRNPNLGFISSDEFGEEEVKNFDFSITGESMIDDPDVGKTFSLSEEDKQKIIDDANEQDTIFEREELPNLIEINSVQDIKNTIFKSNNPNTIEITRIQDIKDTIKKDNNPNPIKNIDVEKNCSKWKYTFLGIGIGSLLTYLIKK